MLSDRKDFESYTRNIVKAIFGNKSFNYLPNRRADSFFESKHLKHINNSAGDTAAFEEAFNFLKHNGYIVVLLLTPKHIDTTYFDAIDLQCGYAKKEFERCYIQLTQKGLDAWYQLRKTGKWE